MVVSGMRRAKTAPTTVTSMPMSLVVPPIRRAVRAEVDRHPRLPKIPPRTLAAATIRATGSMATVTTVHFTVKETTAMTTVALMLTAMARQPRKFAASAEVA